MIHLQPAKQVTSVELEIRELGMILDREEKSAKTPT
jgi:hypothetical protein